MPEPTAQKRVACFLPDMAGGGAERVMLASMRDLIRKGHGVDLLVMRNDGALMSLLPPEVRVFNLGVTRLRQAILPIARYLRTERPDAMHAQMWPTTIIAIIAHRLARSGARVLVSDQTALSRHMRSEKELAALRWTTRLFYPLADFRVMCSVAAADDLSDASGIDRRSLEVITNPVEPPERLSTNEKVEAFWGNSKGRVLNIGSFKAQKNQALLLKAFALSKARPDSKLLILGEGPLRQELERLTQSLGVAERVVMPGFDIDPWPYLASADMFVLSSDFEGYPLVLAEAMYAGLRLISTDCLSGPAEITDGGKFGLLVPCGDDLALAAGIDAAWDREPDVARQRERALEVAGVRQIARYTELLVHEIPTPRERP